MARTSSHAVAVANTSLHTGTFGKSRVDSRPIFCFALLWTLHLLLTLCAPVSIRNIRCLLVSVTVTCLGCLDITFPFTIQLRLAVLFLFLSCSSVISHVLSCSCLHTIPYRLCLSISSSSSCNACYLDVLRVRRARAIQLPTVLVDILPFFPSFVGRFAFSVFELLKLHLTLPPGFIPLCFAFHSFPLIVSSVRPSYTSLFAILGLQ